MLKKIRLVSKVISISNEIPDKFKRRIAEIERLTLLNEGNPGFGNGFKRVSKFSKKHCIVRLENSFINPHVVIYFK